MDDALSGLAPLLRVRPELEVLCRFGGAWSSPHERSGGWAYFHIVTKGRCVIERPRRQILTLEAGDLLLLPHGDQHNMRSIDPSQPYAPPMAVSFNNAIRIKSSEGTPSDTELICGILHFEAASQNLVIAALPDVIVVRAGGGSLMQSFAPIMAAIRDELDGGRSGAAAIATDLASALMIMMLRGHLESEPPAEGLLALLGQKMTAQVGQAMLKDPARDWGLDQLAEIGVASRATLVRGFRKASGMAPLAFLTELRLSLARQRLLSGNDTIAQIAEEVGYQSEAALSRAFQRRFAIRPGKLRDA